MSAYERALYREAELRLIESQNKTALWLDVIIPFILTAFIWVMGMLLMFAMGPGGIVLLPFLVGFTLVVSTVIT